METFPGFAVACLALAFAGCGAQSEAPVEAEAAAAGDSLEIQPGPTILPRLKAGEVGWATVGASITVAGRVDVDETRVTRVGSPVMGRVVSLTAHVGEQARHGQVLATLNSTGLSDAQLAFLKALSQKQVEQRAVERAQVLLNAGVIGVAELQRREAELSQATAELDAARNELLLLGMPPEDVEQLQKTRTIHSISRVLATMDGTVLSRKATLGQVVQAGETLYEIADLSHVWLVADVPEHDAGHLAAGQEVEAQIPALPGHVIHGQLSFVSATVNPETRTVTVRMDVPNRDKKLKPAMLATMILKEQPQKQLVVPLSAVVREENREWVFVQRDAGRFVLREVKLGGEYGGHRVLLEGVSPGERIVLDGAFHLNNERRRRAIRGSEGS